MTDQKLTAATFAGAAAFLVLSVIHATQGTFDDELTTTVDYLNDIAFTIALFGSAALAQLLGRAGAPRNATFLATVGPLIVSVGVIAGLILGHSPSWFAAVGVPGNLMWMAGMILMAVWAVRTRALPAWQALTLPLIVLCGLVFAEFGASVVSAALLVALAARLGSAPALGRTPVRGVA